MYMLAHTLTKGFASEWWKPAHISPPQTPSRLYKPTNPIQDIPAISAAQAPPLGHLRGTPQPGGLGPRLGTLNLETLW